MLNNTSRDKCCITPDFSPAGLLPLLLPRGVLEKGKKCLNREECLEPIWTFGKNKQLGGDLSLPLKQLNQGIALTPSTNLPDAILWVLGGTLPRNRDTSFFPFSLLKSLFSLFLIPDCQQVHLWLKERNSTCLQILSGRKAAQRKSEKLSQATHSLSQSPAHQESLRWCLNGTTSPKRVTPCNEWKEPDSFSKNEVNQTCQSSAYLRSSEWCLTPNMWNSTPLTGIYI